MISRNSIQKAYPLTSHIRILKDANQNDDMGWQHKLIKRQMQNCQQEFKATLQTLGSQKDMLG